MVKTTSKAVVTIVWTSLLALLVGALLDVNVVSAQSTVWTRQWGTSKDDHAHAVFVYSSGVYVAAYTSGALPGQTSKGGEDAYVRKYDVYGSLKWTRQFGTTGNDGINGVSVNSSGVYVAGWAGGALPGQTSKGKTDAFVRKYDFYGNLKWTRQFGSPNNDYAYAISVVSSGIFVAGYTSGALPGQTNKGLNDAFICKYDVDGNLKWTRQFGSSNNDYAFRVSAYSLGVYVVGVASGALPGQASKGLDDAFVCKYDVNGNLKWTRQFGSASSDTARGVSADSSGVYVAGLTYGALPGQASKGWNDAFVCKYDVDGNLKWTRQFGTSSYDEAWGVSVYSSRVYVVGYTYGALPGQSNKGGGDAFVCKYDVYGNPIWTLQFGTSYFDSNVDVHVVSSGAYVVGCTLGALPGKTYAGGLDAFVCKIAPP